jgi:hypothetical protein
VDTVDREENGCCVYTSSVPHKADLYRNWNYDMQSRFSNVRTTGYHDKILQKAASAEGAKGGNCLAGACEMTEKELLDVLASDRLERVRGHGAQASAVHGDESQDAVPSAKKIKRQANKAPVSQFAKSTTDIAFLHTLMPPLPSTNNK